MSHDEQTQIARTGRERTDLCEQYRPIGIGAVAAALMAGNRPSAADNRAAANSNEAVRGDKSLAA